MPSYTINFNTKRDKRQLFEHLKTLKGIYQVTTRKVRAYNGRYKYYWAYVLPIIEQANVFVNDYQEPLNKDEIHDALKVMFNPKIINTVNNRVIIQGDTTTKLSDFDFIENFEDKIIAYFASEPYFLEFPLSRYEWTENKIKQHENS